MVSKFIAILTEIERGAYGTMIDFFTHEECVRAFIADRKWM